MFDVVCDSVSVVGVSMFGVLMCVCLWLVFVCAVWCFCLVMLSVFGVWCGGLMCFDWRDFVF